MRVYSVAYCDEIEGWKRVWSASKKDAAKAATRAKRSTNMYGTKPQIDVHEVETTRDGLLKFLNAKCVSY